MTMRELADYYHGFDFNIIPLANDKRPVFVGVTKAGQPFRFKWDAYASTKQSRSVYKSIRARPWWSEVQGIAAACGLGSSGLVCIDFDSKAKDDPFEDEIDPGIIADFVAAQGLPAGYEWIAKTPTGGWHVWIRCPDLDLDKGKLDRPGIHRGVSHVELRWTGSYAVLPGSLHPNGERYSFASGRPAQGPSTVPPDDLLAAYGDITEDPPPEPPRQPVQPGSGPGPALGTTPYAQAAMASELEELRTTPQGQRNDALNKAAFRLGQLTPHELSTATAMAALVEIGISVGLPESEAKTTAASGLSGGADAPRYPDHTPPGSGSGGNGAGYSAGFTEDAPDGLEEDPEEELPLIRVNNRQLRDVRRDTLAALQLWNAQTPTHPYLFVRGGALVRVARDENNLYAAQLMDTPAMAGLLADCADWVRVGSKGTVTHITPPSDVVRDVLSLGEWDSLPPLAGIVQAPTYGQGHQLHNYPGYSPHTALYYANYVECEQMAIEDARQLILEDLLGDFPFVDDASKAHAVALLLLPFVRPLVTGATPLHMVDAPTPGTGKGLLVEICSMPALGRSLPSMAAGRDDEEWRKRLTSTLMRGDSHIHIDNITAALDSGVLASALTQDTWEDRLLGQTKTVRLQIRQIWAANGNNLVMSDEIARRTVWIRMDANHERPWERNSFRHRNIRAWALQERPRLIAAALAMVQTWIEAAAPRYEEKHKGSYESWGRSLGGNLLANGIEGFLGNEEKLYEGKVNTNSAMTELVQAWHDNYATARVDSGELFKLASAAPENEPLMTGYEKEQWLGLLDDLLTANSERGRRKQFGNLLKSYADKVVSGYKVLYEGRSHGKTWYRLAIIDESKAQEASLEELGL